MPIKNVTQTPAVARRPVAPAVEKKPAKVVVNKPAIADQFVRQGARPVPAVNPFEPRPEVEPLDTQAEIRRLRVENARLGGQLNSARRRVADDIADFDKATANTGVYGDVNYWCDRFGSSRTLGNDMFGALYDEDLNADAPLDEEVADEVTARAVDPAQQLADLEDRNAILRDDLARAKRALDRGKPAWTKAGAGGNGDVFYWVSRYKGLREAGLRRLKDTAAALTPAVK